MDRYRIGAGTQIDTWRMIMRETGWERESIRDRGRGRYRGTDRDSD